MSTLYFNSNISDDERRRGLYAGHLFVYSPRESTKLLCDLARELSEETFAPYHPTEAQHHMSVEDYVAKLAVLKPEFIHHPIAKTGIRNLLEDLHCDLEKTYFDVPRLRTATSDGYLTSGLGYVFAPHRDTWYSAPMFQLNWWLPIYDFESNSAMAFHPAYWGQPVANDSEDFDYQDWVQTDRKTAASHVQSDSRKQSKVLEPLDLDPQIRIVPEPGGLIVFSAAQMHSSVPNTSGLTRFSVDFRTVHRDDAGKNFGAFNCDSACSGTTMTDYLRGSNFEHFSDEEIDDYMHQRNNGKVLAASPQPLPSCSSAKESAY